MNNSVSLHLADLLLQHTPLVLSLVLSTLTDLVLPMFSQQPDPGNGAGPWQDLSARADPYDDEEQVCDLVVFAYHSLASC